MKHHTIDQNTDEWHALRYGIPTASRASDLVSSGGILSKSLPRYAEELAMNLYAGKSLSSFAGNRSTERGHEIEPVAAKWYAFERDTDPQECGFFTDDLQRYGASPDRLIGEDGLLEIKCQESKGHLKSLLAYTKTQKPPSDYLSQIQMQLLATQRKWLDLVLYHPDLPSSIIRIEPDLDFHGKLKSQITACVLHRELVLKTLNEIK
jgi:hypothetical protein